MLDSYFDPSLLGTKASSLSRCIAANSTLYYVPRGFILNAAFYKWQVSGLLYIESLIGKCDFTDYRSIYKTSQEVQSIIRNICIEKSKLSYWLGPLDRPWIIRSSSPYEAYAGVYESFAMIDTITEVQEKVKDVFASLYSPRALIYRHQHKVSHKNLYMPVLIQEFIEGEQSGILFTKHPDTSEDSMHLVTARGGCGQLVEGIADSTEYILKDFKTQYMRRNQNSETLKNADLYKLEMVGRELEHIFQTPLDIEWTIKKGTLYILQVRPITVRPVFAPAVAAKKSTRTPLVSGMAIRSISSVKAIRGRAHIYRSDSANNFNPGDILVCDITTPDMEPLMACAGGLVTNHGVRTSHSAIRSREMNLPAIIGTVTATDKIIDKQQLELNFNDPYKGVVYNG